MNTILFGISLLFNIIILVILHNKNNDINNIRAKLEKYKQITKNSSIESLTESHVKNLIAKYFGEKKNLDALMDEIRRLLKLDEEERDKEALRMTKTINSNITPLRTEEHKSLSSVGTLYAGSPEGNTFFKVYNYVNDNVIFELICKDSNVLEFKVHNSAQKRVLLDQSFLENACEIQIMSKGEYHQLEMLENGIAEKQSDGKWRIIKKGKVQLV